MTKTPTYPIATPLRQRINRAAHEQGLAHELALRASWLAKVQSARNQGANFEALNKLVDTLVTVGR